MVGSYVFAQDKDFLERVVDALEGCQFVLALLITGQGIGGLDVITFVAFVSHKIHLQLLALGSSTGLYHTNINTISTAPQLIVDNILHDMGFLHLTEIKQCVAQTNVLEIVL